MRKIFWKKYKNPLISVNDNGEEDEQGKLILKQTPFGIQAMKINPDALDELRWYVGHTNFDIDEEVKEVLDDIPGVEALNIFSAYRFRAAIGKAFNTKKVLLDINNALCQESKLEIPTDIQAKIFNERFQLENSGKQWLIYILPNGKYEVEKADTVDDIVERIKVYNKVKEQIGGYLLTS